VQHPFLLVCDAYHPRDAYRYVSHQHYDNWAQDDD
jgi:hypothetical protein